MRIHHKRHFKKNNFINSSVYSIEKETVDSIHEKDCFEINNYLINNNISINNNNDENKINININITNNNINFDYNCYNVYNVNINEWNEMMKEISYENDLNNFELVKIEKDEKSYDDLNYFTLLNSELNPSKFS